MLINYNPKKTKLLLITFIITISVFLQGCVSWLVPKVEQNVTQLKPGAYELDPDHATLLFKVKHLGLSDFVGSFDRFSVALDFDPNNIESTQLHALIDITSLDVNNTNFEEQLAGKGWLNSNEYPQAEFTSKSIQKITSSEASSQKYQFNGQLNWRGYTNPVQFIVTFNGGANNWLTGKYTIGVSAVGQFNRSDFGMDKYKDFVSDQVNIEVYAEFQKG
ncbi:YceI family protein [Sessilibacter sp. MAH4]